MAKLSKKEKELAAAQEKKKRLGAMAEAHERVFYYLMNSVARADDEYLAEAAKELANEHKQHGLSFREAIKEVV